MLTYIFLILYDDLLTNTGLVRNKLGESVRRMVNDEVQSDLVFTFPEGKRLFAHRILVYLRCKKFAEQHFSTENHTTRRNDAEEIEREEISITEVPHAVFYQFLLYIYTDRIGKPSSQLHFRYEPNAYAILKQRLA